jgi:flagellin
MALRINTNVQSLSAQHHLETSRNKLDDTQSKMATGSRIVNPGDDAAGLAISENLRSDMRATGQNIRNAQSGMFLLHTADGAMNEVSNILIRMKELAVQSSSGTNGDKERGYLDNEYQALKLELDRISGSTLFNGKPLLTGEGGDVSIQIGPNNNEPIDRITVAANFEINNRTLGIDGLDITSEDSARSSLDPITGALEKIAQVRGAIGAGESRLSTSMNALGQYEENVSKAFSQIRDADMALETANFAKYNILSQAGVSVLAQANNSPQLALKLLG